ncbi:MAG: M20/M25/M40 family metallo-hydrolase [Bacteroidales bacterium]|jgi:hypothetical protein|nr:M20/M25/M40 family metallo-hydrolase [Bacteroidales bacterium]
MKKNIILTLCFLLVSIVTFAGKFILIPVTETDNLESLFNNNDLKIHYYNDNYVLATADVINYNNAVVLDEHAFADVDAYAIVYCNNDYKEEYLSNVSKSDHALYFGDHFMIMKILSNDFKPAKNDGMVAITNTEASLSRSVFDYPVITEPDENIQSFISQVSTDSVMGYIQSLEDFVTRNCHHANHIAAQNWIKDQYESLGLEVQLHNFNWNYGSPYNNNNVIAIQYGTEFPDEFIVLGGHYDSYTESQNNAPGADDDASGTAGVMETARILSQYDFKRSIIYCAFSAEEYGLYGSGAFAQKCYNEGKNILGYFNLDMTGYLRPEDPIHFCLIYPTNPALTLADYFVNVCDVYFPTIPVTRHSNLPWGDSDHTSFNNKGFKGIWWFEDINCDSPYIHHTAGSSGCGNGCTGNIPCLGDIIGPSVNNPEQVTAFTQAMVASIATLAVFSGEMPPPIAPPTNCIAQYIEDMGVKISWDAPEQNTPVEYYVYRDGDKISQTSELFYEDTINGFGLYCYQVTAIYNIEDELIESNYSNESCALIPPPIMPPTNCLAQYIEEVGIEISWEPPIVDINVEHYVLYRDNAQIDKTQQLSYLDSVTDVGWYCYQVAAVFKINDEMVESALSNESCDSVPFIDDNIIEYNSNYKIFPNPTTGELQVTSNKLQVTSDKLQVEIYDVFGRAITTPYSLLTTHYSINVSHLPAGIYFIKIGDEFVGKFVKTT